MRARQSPVDHCPCTSIHAVTGLPPPTPPNPPTHHFSSSPHPFPHLPPTHLPPPTGGTIRSLSEAGINQLRQRVVEVVTSVAEAHQCTLADSLFSPDYYPPTVNDAALWEQFVAPHVAAAGEVREVPPTLAGEDFSFFAKEVGRGGWGGA